MHDWDRLLDEARADDAAVSRARARWLVRQAGEDATFAGTVLDLAERGSAVSVWTAGGTRHEGVIAGVGTDFLVLRDRGEHVVVRLAAVTVLRPAPGERAVPATGDRPAAFDRSIAELLGQLAPDRPEVAITFAAGDALAGTLVAAGADVLSVRVGEGDGLAYVSLPGCASLRFRSG